MSPVPSRLKLGERPTKGHEGTPSWSGGQGARRPWGQS